jgi:hypothetical protein
LSIKKYFRVRSLIVAKFLTKGYNPIGDDLVGLLASIPAIRFTFVRQGDRLRAFASVGNADHHHSAMNECEFTASDLFATFKKSVEEIAEKLAGLSDEELESLATDSVAGMHWDVNLLASQAVRHPQTVTPPSNGGPMLGSGSLLTSAGGTSLTGGGGTFASAAQTSAPSLQDAVQAALDALKQGQPAPGIDPNSIVNSSGGSQPTGISSLPVDAQKRIRHIQQTLVG